MLIRGIFYPLPACVTKCQIRTFGNGAAAFLRWESADAWGRVVGGSRGAIIAFAFRAHHCVVEVIITFLLLPASDVLGRSAEIPLPTGPKHVSYQPRVQHRCIYRYAWISQLIGRFL